MIRTRERLAKIDAIKKQIVEEVRWDLNWYKEQGTPMTQTGLGKLVGLSQAEISDMLRGRTSRFTVDRLLMVLIALGHKPTVSVC